MLFQLTVDCPSSLCHPLMFSQEWIHKITDNLLIKSKAESSKGRDNYGRNKSPRQLEQTSAAPPIKKEKKLIDENEAIYGIGYLNPAFDDNQSVVVKTPESSPIDVPHRSRKSSAKSEKVKAKIVDVSKTVRRKLDLSSVPDVVQTSRGVQIDDDLPSPCSDTDAHMADEEEFFLAKNSKLFSQVSSNTLTATDTKTFALAGGSQQNPFRVVEVKEMEIIKSVASPEDHVILPSANVSVGLNVPQVVERVEIVEDTETEAESIDTDTEDKEGRGKLPPRIVNVEQVVKKKELVPILKKSPEPAVKNIKRIILKLDLDSDQEKVSDSNKGATFFSKTPVRKTEAAGFSSAECSKRNEQLTENVSKPRTVSTWKDKESVAEYLILDDGEEIEKSDSKTNEETDCAKLQGVTSTSKDRNDQKETTTEKELLFKTQKDADTSRSEEDKLGKKLSQPKRSKNLSKDDTLEDCDSFYGSDKETDDVLIFSDDTEIDVGSSSSDEEDPNLGEHVEHLLDKVTRVSRKHTRLSISALFIVEMLIT